MLFLYSDTGAGHRRAAEAVSEALAGRYPGSFRSCRAIERVLFEGQDGATYNVGSGVEASIADLAEAILRPLGPPHSMIEIVPDRPGHDRRYLPDSSLIGTSLGWAPEVDFGHGLADTIDWSRAIVTGGSHYESGRW